MNWKKAKLIMVLLLLGVASNGFAIENDDEYVTIHNNLYSFTKMTEGYVVDMDDNWITTTTNKVVIKPKSSSYDDFELISPEIDLTDYHDVSLVFKLACAGVSVYDYNLYIKEVNSGNWVRLAIPNKTPIQSTKIPLGQLTYSEPEVIDLYYYQGKTIQIKFIIKISSTSYSWGIKDYKIVGKEGYKEKEIVDIDGVNDISDLLEGKYVRFNIQNDEVVFGDWNTALVKGDNLRYVIESSGEGSYPNAKLNGEIIAKYHNQLGLPVFYEIYQNYSRTYNYDEDDYYNGERYDPTVINEDEYSEYLGHIVNMRTVSSEILIEDPFIVHSDKYDTSKFDYADVWGIVYPTKDNKKRLVLYSCGFSPIPILNENRNYDFESDTNQYCELRRSLKAGNWYSLTLPFNYTFTYNSTVASYVSSYDGVLNFEVVENGKMTVGIPYLIKPANDINTISGYIKGAVTASSVTGGDYNFTGTFSPVQPNEGTYYLSSGNTIKPLASGGTINGFRAYFEPSTPNVSLARAISIDGEITAIENIDFGDDILFGQPKKIYNLNGQYVGDNLDALPKGVYLVNGKKVTK